MTVHIRDLQPRDELWCYMRTGFAVTYKNTIHGIKRFVPLKPQVTGSSDWSVMSASVVSLDYENRLLTVQATKKNYKGHGINRETAVVEIPFWSIWRLRRVSKISFEPREPNATRSPSVNSFRPYRTLETVELPPK